MTPNDYQRLALRTEKTPAFVRPEPMDGWAGQREDVAHVKARLMHGALGVCTEAGELQDVLKKHLIYGKPLDNVNLMEECGDVLWYLAVILDAAGYTLEEAMEINIAKLRKRYGDKFSEAAALNRDLEGEREVLSSTEVRAKAIYDSWEGMPGWIPWVDRGNSIKQDLARHLARL